MPSDTFSLINKTPRTVRGIPFRKLKEATLGKRYVLSVALVGKRESRAITKKTKKKNKTSNVLAFPLSRSSGEIILTPALAKDNLPHLFIHGLLHLKGLKHSARMESTERQILKRFGIRL